MHVRWLTLAGQRGVVGRDRRQSTSGIPAGAYVELPGAGQGVPLQQRPHPVVGGNGDYRSRAPEIKGPGPVPASVLYPTVLR